MLPVMILSFFLSFFFLVLFPPRVTWKIKWEEVSVSGRPIDNFQHADLLSSLPLQGLLLHRTQSNKTPN